MTFRLLTYNIKNGGRGRVDALSAVITSCTPDVVLLQEATDAHVVNALASRLGFTDFRTFRKQSLAFMSRSPVDSATWIRPRLSRHAFIEISLRTPRVRLFGVHLSAVLSALTERRRVFELRALLRSIARHQHGFHLLAGDFNTVAPGDAFDARRLPLRLKPFVWMSGRRIRWRTIQHIRDAGYVDAFRLKHPDDPGLTLPTSVPHVRLDYVFVPAQDAQRILACQVVTHARAAEASDHFPVAADVLV